MSLFINDVDIQKGHFPNMEVDYNVDTLTETPEYLNNNQFIFRLAFQSNADLWNMLMLSKYIDDQFPRSNKILDISFMPYSQMDRKMESHLFSLKYVAQLINDCSFTVVLLHDPHSIVSPALINRCHVSYPVKDFLTEHASDYDLLFYPDNGACKKYAEILNDFSISYRFGEKKRNLDTGEIERYIVHADENEVRGKRVLIIDDLVMGGRTFVEAATVLRNMGAANVDFYVTHLMPQARNFWRSKGNGLIDNIYSADTLSVVDSFKASEPRP